MSPDDHKLDLYRKAFERSTEGILVHGPQGELLDINEAGASIAGYTREEFQALRPEQYVHPDSVPIFLEYLQALREGRSFQCAVKGFHKDGSVIHLDIQGIPFEQDGEPRMLCLHRDMTAERRLEDTVREGEAFYRKVFDSSSVGLLLLDSNARVVEANPALAAMHGYRPEEVRGLPVRCLVHPDSLPTYDEYRQVTARGEIFRGQGMHLRKDGTTLHIEGSVVPIEYRGEAHLLAMLQDVTERHEAGAALAQSEELYRAVFDTTADGLLLADASYRFVDANPAAWEMHGYTRDEFLAKAPLDLVPPEYLGRFHEFTKAMEAGRVFRTEARHRHRDGSTFPVELTGSPFLLRGEPHSMVSIRDITDRQRLQTELRQAQKMEAVGRLAGGVAHDFNNLLHSIMGFGKLLEEELPPDGALASHARTIVDVARRAAGLTGQLLTFSRRSPTRSEPVDVHEVIREAVRLLEQTTDRRVDLELALDDGPAIVTGDPGHLQNVFLNLGINACDAIEGHGKVTIRSAREVADEALVRAHGALVPGAAYLRVTVTDDGQGIAPAELEYLFDPFFTTKEVGKGTGLGLATVHGVVREHAGAVAVESEVGAGSSFSIYLPLSDAAPPEARQPTAAPRAPAGTGTILVVDDEEVARVLSRALLERLGYRVLTAADGVEGLEVFRREAVDLVLLDLVMPRMNGTEMLERLRRLDAVVPVIVCSGFPLGEEGSGPGPDQADGYLPKPVEPRDLAATIAALLEARGPA